MPDVTRKIGQATSSNGDEPTPRYFANLLNQRLAELGIEPQKRASYLATLDDIERPGKKIVHTSNANEWVNAPRGGWLKPESYRNLAHHLRMPGMPLVEASALELGLTWGAGGRSNAWWVPTTFDALPDEDKEVAIRVLRDLIAGLARARGMDR